MFRFILFLILIGWWAILHWFRRRLISGFNQVLLLWSTCLKRIHLGNSLVCVLGGDLHMLLKLTFLIITWFWLGGWQFVRTWYRLFRLARWATRQGRWRRGLISTLRHQLFLLDRICILMNGSLFLSTAFLDVNLSLNLGWLIGQNLDYLFRLVFL